MEAEEAGSRIYRTCKEVGGKVLSPKVVEVGDCQAAPSPTPFLRAAPTQDMLGRKRETGGIFRQQTEVENVIIPITSTKK